MAGHDAGVRDGTSQAARLLAAPRTEPLLPSMMGVGAVQARELASGSGSRGNKDPQSLLRRGAAIRIGQYAYTVADDESRAWTATELPLRASPLPLAFL